MLQLVLLEEKITKFKPPLASLGRKFHIVSFQSLHCHSLRSFPVPVFTLHKEKKKEAERLNSTPFGRPINLSLIKQHSRHKPLTLQYNPSAIASVFYFRLGL